MFTSRKVPPSPRSTYSRISVPVTSHSSARFPDWLPPTSREQPTALRKPTASRCTRCSHSPPRPLQHPPRPGDATCLLGKLTLATADLHPWPSPPTPHGGGPCSSTGSREEKGPTPSSHAVTPLVSWDTQKTLSTWVVLPGWGSGCDGVGHRGRRDPWTTVLPCSRRPSLACRPSLASGYWSHAQRSPRKGS